jgi:hypothetical protein
MPTEHILALLIAERDRLTRAIDALEGGRRGGSPKAPSTAPQASTRKPRRRRSAAQRKAQSERMKNFWAQRRKKKS